jgi:hypothetical protein
VHCAPASQCLHWCIVADAVPFYTAQQIAIGRVDLKRPPGQHEKRWAKYKDVTLLPGGTLHIPNNKRAKKLPALYTDIPIPMLLNETVSDKQRDRQGNKLVTYTVSLIARNGFVIVASRASSKGAKLNAAQTSEEILVNVLHHPFVDEFGKSGVLDRAFDELDPLLLLNKKSVKVKREDGSSCRTYNVLVGSSYIDGVDDLTGRRILAAERIGKVRFLNPSGLMDPC